MSSTNGSAPRNRKNWKGCSSTRSRISSSTCSPPPSAGCLTSTAPAPTTTIRSYSAWSYWKNGSAPASSRQPRIAADGSAIVKGAKTLKPFQSDGTFHPIVTGKDLRRTAVRGAGAATAGSAGNFALQIGSIGILARLLFPSDFGIVTMVTTFSLLLRSFGLACFTEFIMQHEDLTDSLASNLFWINLGIGTVLTLAFAASGHLLAAFFHNPAVVGVTYGMSLTIVIGCLGYVHTGLLQRAMQFRTTAIIS